MDATLLAECQQSRGPEQSTDRIADPLSDHDVIMTDVDYEREISTTSPLQALPGELLNRIYRYAVVENGMVVAASFKLLFKKRWRVKEPALSRVCRRFRADVLPIYYAENTFTFRALGRFERRPPHVYRSWLRAIGEKAFYITSIGAELHDAKGSQTQEMKATIPSTKLGYQNGGQVGELSKLGYGENKSYSGMLPFTFHISPSTSGDCMCWATRARVDGLACLAMERKERIVCALLFCDEFFRRLMDEDQLCLVCGRKLSKRLKV